MSKEIKSKSNNFQSFSSINPIDANKKNDFSSSNYTDDKEHKNEGNNNWSSVPVTYDKEESTRKHEKTATDNQWCSTNK
jgi:hypothetical protein